MMKKMYKIHATTRTNLEKVVEALTDALHSGAPSAGQAAALRRDLARGNRLLVSARGALADGLTVRRVREFIDENRAALAA